MSLNKTELFCSISRTFPLGRQKMPATFIGSRPDMTDLISLQFQLESGKNRTGRAMKVQMQTREKLLFQTQRIAGSEFSVIISTKASRRHTHYRMQRLRSGR